MKKETYACLALSLVPGLGTRCLNQLIQKCGPPNELLKLSSRKLAQLSLSDEIRAFISSGCALRAADQAIQDAKGRGIDILSIFDEEYPHLLKQIFDPPAILYWYGNLAVLCRPSIAVVGSRRCSVYGKEVTQKITRELSPLGICIVSGMARGIDSQAHVGAFQGGGTTVAVLGNGVDVIYPRENRRLYHRICKEGCIISEFPCGSFPAPQNFPIRNRIISGLCYGTVITEASEFSGSLITARLTLEQDRELWAVPGNIVNPGSYGPNYLIKQGAKIVLDTQDILEELPPYVLDLLARETIQSAPSASQLLTPKEEQVLKLLSSEASIPFDQLLNASDLALTEVNQLLLQLELKGLIRQLPGRKFSRTLP
ncbi:DNA-processing protein DprA [Acidobacteria bacterium AH-259-D05]|nr:DNA-processing protein DprA [Acidobacteria bacterium AH-259-D05]